MAGNKKLCSRREAARCFVFVVSFNIPTAQFFITAASYLLVHTILLNSVLLSPIVSGGVRPKLPGQTPLGHNPPCFLTFVGRLGSGPRLVGRIGSGVRVIPAGFCPTAAENIVMTKRVVSGGGFDLRLRRITSSPSQTLRRRLVRTTDAAVSARLDAVRHGFIFHTSRLVRFTTLYAVYAAIFVQNRVFCLPHLHSTPPLGGFPSEYRDPVWHEKN